jgi:hypothetical protein
MPRWATAEQRFWRKLEQNGPIPAHRPDLGRCWIWKGSIDSMGYGRFRAKSPQYTKTHRFSFELHYGPMPPQLQTDHLCRNHACANPAHLEAVTCRQNVMRGKALSASNAKKSHCKRGHPFTKENTKLNSDGGRICITCVRKYDREWKKAKATSRRLQLAERPVEANRTTF